MKWIIFVFSLLPTIYCYHQKWQVLSDYQKDLLFPNVTVDTAAFYDAENMTDVENLCEETANEVEVRFSQFSDQTFINFSLQRAEKLLQTPVRRSSSTGRRHRDGLTSCSKSFHSTIFQWLIVPR